jgi:hypothetical protein
LPTAAEGNALQPPPPSANPLLPRLLTVYIATCARARLNSTLQYSHSGQGAVKRVTGALQDRLYHIKALPPYPQLDHQPPSLHTRESFTAIQGDPAAERNSKLLLKLQSVQG